MSTQICAECKITFDYPNKEFNRRSKKGITDFFCSLSCATKTRNRRSPQICKNNIQKAHEANKKNNFKHQKRATATGFARYLNKCKNRAKVRNNTYDLDEEHLQSIWTGRCAITDLPIHLKQYKTKRSTTMASLDRIDSNMGYVKGNVQFVAYAVNLAKNDFTNQQIKEFFELLKK